MKPVIKLKTQAILDLQENRCLNNVELADRSFLSPSQIGRVKKELNLPGEDFIAGMLHAFPDKKFEDLFFLEPSLQESQERNLKPTGTEK
jgi:hypothetical protein